MDVELPKIEGKRYKSSHKWACSLALNILLQALAVDNFQGNTSRGLFTVAVALSEVANHRANSFAGI